MADSVMSFTEHLEELRKRLKYALYSVIICMLVVYPFADFMFAVVAQPLMQAWQDAGLGRPTLHFASAFEPFFTMLELALIAGLFLSSPFVFYQLWRFVSPGLYHREKRYALPFAVASGLLFTGGAMFGYFFVFPMGFRYAFTFAKSNMGRVEAILGKHELFGKKLNFSLEHTFKLAPTLMMGEYFGLIWRLLLAFGLVFELPLVLLFLSMAGLVDYKSLWRFNRYFVVIAFVLGAVLTPSPDWLTQTGVALPLVVLYNLSILLSFLFFRKRGTNEATRES